jgi:hypothetical protein
VPAEAHLKFSGPVVVQAKLKRKLAGKSILTRRSRGFFGLPERPLRGPSTATTSGQCLAPDIANRNRIRLSANGGADSLRSGLAA